MMILQPNNSWYSNQTNIDTPTQTNIDTPTNQPDSLTITTTITKVLRLINWSTMILTLEYQYWSWLNTILVLNGVQLLYWLEY